MRLKEVMCKHTICLKPDQTIQEATSIFLENHIDGAPVVDDQNKLIGLFTKKAIYQAVAKGQDLSTSVGQVMKKDIQIAHPDERVAGVLHPGLGRLPIVDETGIVGMVTRTDLARVFFNSYNKLSMELETIINSTYNTIISIDQHGFINLINKPAERILGVSAEEVKGKPVSEVFPNSRLMDVVLSGKAEAAQRINLKGSYYLSNRSPIKKGDRIMGAVAVLQDISELENVSQELKVVKELNEELDAIIESSFDGLYITDGNGVTLRLNKAFEMITGISANEFLGRNVETIKREGIISESVSYLVLKRRQPVTIIQTARTGKTTLSTGNPVFDRQGNLIRVVCNVRDITELNLLKQKLEKLEGLSHHYENQLRSLRMRYSDSDSMVVHSNIMKRLLDLVLRLSRVDSTVLINGESGTGKELIVETIHYASERKNGPLVKVNCGAIPEGLLESELFGYEAGSFTGSKKEGNAGYFELAEGGTIFLDEIGDLPLNLQVKLLRVLQSKEITRVGAGKAQKIDVRIIAATNRDLNQMVHDKAFREDLYYRLNVIPILVPPLRDRKEEIPYLVAHFMQIFNRKYQLIKRISPDVIHLFLQYHWPGNIRELENLIERLVVMAPNDLITLLDLPVNFQTISEDDRSQVVVSGILPLRNAIESVEKQLIEKAYAQFSTTRQMAKALQVNASTIVRKAAKYNIPQNLSRPTNT